jgi:hypothetical protein
MITHHLLPLCSLELSRGPIRAGDFPAMQQVHHASTSISCCIRGFSNTEAAMLPIPVHCFRMAAVTLSHERGMHGLNRKKMHCKSTFPVRVPQVIKSIS